jgi:hypothetical protein
VRRAAKIDNTQAEAVKGLRALGYVVVLLKLPVDVLVRHPSWPTNLWVLGEFKTPTATGRIPKDKRRAEQLAFVNAHGVPYWTGLESAIQYLVKVEYRMSNPYP